jgi:peptidyl-prolyl cis-trans isomerase A (cyclophilin A)
MMRFLVFFSLFVTLLAFGCDDDSNNNSNNLNNVNNSNNSNNLNNVNNTNNLNNSNNTNSTNNTTVCELECNSNSSCQLVESVPSCVCDNGYSGDGDVCVDINECTDGSDDCGSTSTCENSAGGFECICESGFQQYDNECVVETILNYPDLVPTERLELETSMGTMVIRLYGNEAPITVANFLRYVDDGSFTNTIFHRVIEEFMVQGGGEKADGSTVDSYAPITLEVNTGLLNHTGTLAMARTNVLDSATQQFFINVVYNDFLDNQYAVFGEIEINYDVADAMSHVSTNASDYPDTPIEIISISRIGVN